MHSRTEELFPAAVDEWQQHFAAVLQVGAGPLGIGPDSGVDHTTPAMPPAGGCSPIRQPHRKRELQLFVLPEHESALVSLCRM